MKKQGDGLTDERDAREAQEEGSKSQEDNLSSQDRLEFVTQIHANLVLRACITFLKCFRTPVAPIRKS